MKVAHKTHRTIEEIINKGTENYEKNFPKDSNTIDEYFKSNPKLPFSNLPLTDFKKRSYKQILNDKNFLSNEIENKLSAARKFDRHAQYEMSEQVYAEVIEEHPQNITSYIELGKLLIGQQKNYDKAFELFEQALKISNDKTSILFEPIIQLIQSENYLEALKYINKILKIEPDNHEAQNFKNLCGSHTSTARTINVKA